MQTADSTPGLDYAALRQAGLRHLEALTAGEWTDFNPHDPGITILEQFCYALTELAYRIGYDIKDLLADGGEAAPYRALPSPAEALSTAPVTLADFRKMLIDLPGVRNAWVEPVDASGPGLFYDAADGNLYLEAAPHREPLALRGLFQVLLASDGGLPDADLRRAADLCLQACRGLGQVFLPAKILAPQNIIVEAAVAIGSAEDPAQVLAHLNDALASLIAPHIRFRALADCLAEGRPVDAVFDGPALSHGFIDTGELEGFGRAKGLRVSDFVHRIMDVPGVEAVETIRIGTLGGVLEDWYLPLDQDSTPVLDSKNSKIELRRGGVAVAPDARRAEALLEALRKARQPAALPPAQRDLRPPAGRNRKAGRYYSIQHQFPAVYGIGTTGLPLSASPARQAQAKQLKAYLLLFDQLLANGFAQLAQARTLFSIDAPDDLQSYFSQPIDDPRLALAELWVQPEALAATLRRISETSDVATERKNRFLNHLLARFAEDFADFSQAGTAADIAAQIRAKCAFLQDFRRLGGGRGVAFDCGQAGRADNLSGLAARLARKFGLDPCLRQRLAELPPDSAGGFHLVEHILLRPGQADAAALPQGAQAWDDWQAGVLLALPDARKDPYSQQISLILPAWVECFQRRPGAVELLQRLLREEAPAHLHVRLLWLEQEPLRRFEAAYFDWLDNLGDLGATAGALGLRDARDRLLECLGLATPYPLRDVGLVFDRIVALNQSVEIRIEPAQAGVEYCLADENGVPVAGSKGKPVSVLREAGQAPAAAALPKLSIKQDSYFTVLATRTQDVFGNPLDNPLEVYLRQPVSITLGINTGLQVEFRPSGTQTVAQAGRLTVDYGTAAISLVVLASQPGVSYEIRAVVEGVEQAVSTVGKGNKGELKLTAKFTFQENTLLRIRACRTVAPDDAQYLEADLAVWVRPNPKVAVSAGPAVIAYGVPTTLRLDAAQTTVAYQLFKRDLQPSDYPARPSADPATVVATVARGKDGLVPVGEFQWQSGVCTLATPALAEDAVFFVQATHKLNGERLWLEAAAVVLVRPDTAPVVGVEAAGVALGAAGVVTVTGTQRGVRYQLRQQPGSAAVNAPGYHLTERGIGSARVAVDWVVEQPADAQAYAVLRLPTGALQAAATFDVLAIKNLTGLDAVLAATATIKVS